MGRKPKNQSSIKPAQTELVYRKSNSLINAKGKSTALGLKLFAIAVRNIEPQPDGSLKARISGQELRRLFHRSNGSFYTQIKELIKPSDETKPSLLDWRMYIEKENELHGINVITDASFKDGELELRFNSRIKDDVYGLKGSYASLDLVSAIKMTSPHSIRLYEVFKSYMDLERARTGSEGPYVLTYELDELKRVLGIINPVGGKDSSNGGMYSDYTSFRRHVLEKAQKELNEITNFHCEFEGIRSGRGAKITGVRFYLMRLPDKKPDSKPIDAEATEMTDSKFSVIADMNELFDKEDCSLLEVKAICDAAEYDTEKIKTAYALEQHAKNVENFTAWMIAAIKGKYKPAKNSSQQKKTESKTTRTRKKKTSNSFNEHEQQVYDFDEIEKKLQNE